MVTVIGAGVSGLTTAVALRRAGFDAHIVATQRARDTVSWVAAAIWTFPGSDDDLRQRRWAVRTREVFAQLAGDPARGVAELYHVELFREDPGSSWWEGTPWVTRLEPPPTGYAAALGVEGFRADPTVYLPWLERWFGELGGSLTIRRVHSIDELDGPVVNCSALGSLELAADTTLHPIRGQVVAVEAPLITEGIADESDPLRISYVYPRVREVIVGGTRQVGVWNSEPDSAEAERILADAVHLEPRLAGAAVVASRVGLRPGRPTVRLEAETKADGSSLVHNYGHAGHGFLLSWGCAEEAVALLKADGA